MQGKKYITTLKLLKNRARQQETHSSLPPIPDKRYFTMGEAALLCGVKPHVLRYWEQEFQPLKPSKRRGNRRYYQAHDIVLVRQIRKLLYEDGFTIDGARAQLIQSDKGLSQVQETAGIVKKVIAELESVLHNLTSAEVAVTELNGA